MDTVEGPVLTGGPGGPEATPASPDTFAAFVAESEPGLRRALVAACGSGRES
jgi:hypothetical protein